MDNEEIDDDKPEVVLDADLGETASRCKTIGPDVNDYECDDLSEVEEDLDHSIVPIIEISGFSPTILIMKNENGNVGDAAYSSLPPSSSIEEPDPVFRLLTLVHHLTGTLM